LSASGGWVFSARAGRDFKRLDPPVQRRIVAALDRLTDDPPAGDVVRLVNSDEWRLRVGEMWGQIVALHGRYPRALANLKDQWWTDEQHTEMLCALATWRAEIDDAGLDPRDELAFQTQLNDYAHTLHQEGGGVTKTWTPGAPPNEWASE
jgi:hypothetical protein